MEGAWSTVDVLFAKADRGTGAISAQLGDIKSGDVDEADAPVFQSWGLLALPAAPIPGVSAPEAVVLKHPAGDVVIAGRSVRSAAIAGLIAQGESCVFADGSQACTLYKLDGSIVQFTTHDNTKDGRSVYSRISPNGFEQAFPWGRHRVDNTGLHFQHVSGARMDIGSVTAPAPLDQFGSYFSFQAAMGRLTASFVSVGPTGAVMSPVARADATLTALQAIQAAVVSLGALVSAIAATPAVVGAAPSANPAIGVPPAVGAFQSAITAIETATTAIAAAAVGTVPVPGPIGSKSLAAS